MAWVTRGFFQGSMDRMMPSFFGKLSKYHTPTYSIVYYFIFGVPFAFVFADPNLSGFVNTFTALVGLWGIEMIVQSLAALQLPYVKRPLYEGSIRKQPEIASWPVVSLLGIIMLPTSLFVMAGFFQGVAFYSLISMCVQYGFSAAWFVFFARRLKKKQIDVNTIYDSLPPE
jgi:amino acid transporter